MTRIERERRRPWTGAVRFALAGLLIAGTGSAFGCLNRPIARNNPRTTATIVERLTQSSVDKIDLLLAIDNSGSMADKQDILGFAIPDLVEGLVNPRCIPASGMGDAQTVNSPNADCPTGYKREFEPVKDIHIGIISSSLGGHGSGACPATTSPSNVDMAHLLARTNESSATNDIPTYLNKGFLAWDPDQKLAGEPEVADPEDGEADINADSGNDLNDTSLVEQLTAMVKGTGQAGCGFEAQLESVYRFLVDPEPYATIEFQDDKAVPTGLDATVLQQRAEFLRPSSLLAIIMLSDENDCSIREEGRNYLVAETRNGFRLWKPRPECARDPGDKCCRSCSQNDDDCPAAEVCTGDDGFPARLSAAEDPVNSRCWDQKRRFGFDFLYPIERYRRAFTEAQIENRRGELVPNPIFSDPNPDDDDNSIRDPGLVFFAGIVGVPWQDIARVNEAGQPDLLRGLNQDGEPVGGFKNADELSAPLLGGAFSSTWEIILGDPANYQPPKDPFMVESTAPRSGSNPITGDTIVPPTEAGWNGINGREYTIPTGSTGDLQYACIFDLIDSKTCEGNSQSCDCREVGGQPNDNPLCEPEAGNDEADPQPRTTTQIKAKAYPGLRELQLIRELGPQGIVGSVCPRQLNNDNAADYGYRPAIGAIIDRLKTVLGGQCLPRTLTPEPGDPTVNPTAGQVQCLILEARNTQGACDCGDTEARANVTEDHKAAMDKVLADPIAQAAGWDCVCEIEQLAGAEANACRNDPSDNVRVDGNEVNGWCYIDPSIRVGNPEIVASCPPTEQRIIRFTNKGEAQQGATLFITCSGE
ncbi:hypothetical protein [Sorangium cellulosum]|uniref:Uncharacterized protein n=1 Tax=Sorangium cellulosum TaxID=56 RepID=A0A150Q9H0_SORCE|nr:hypothetical protein [Sorangium cellulosum]KYF64406.1 hypothetical protein BE15_23325 [Sorangium cellulosum]